MSNGANVSTKRIGFVRTATAFLGSQNAAKESGCCPDGDKPACKNIGSNEHVPSSLLLFTSSIHLLVSCVSMKLSYHSEHGAMHEVRLSKDTSHFCSAASQSEQQKQQIQMKMSYLGSELPGTFARWNTALPAAVMCRETPWICLRKH